MTAPLVIYLHGFLSSPNSEKAIETRDWLAEHCPEAEFICPQINNLPDLAAAQLIELIEPLLARQPVLMGSSMGGFYCAWLSAKYGLKAVLVNPAVYIDTLLQAYLGENINPYTQQRFLLTPYHIDILAQMNTLEAEQTNLYMLLQTGDETLNYENALARYPHAKVLVEAGGNHRFDGYQQHLPNIMQFLEIHTQ